MSENDAELADELWPNRHEGSLFFLKRLIKLNPNIGAYTKDGELVAWCFRYLMHIVFAFLFLHYYLHHYFIFYFLL